MDELQGIRESCKSLISDLQFSGETLDGDETKDALISITYDVSTLTHWIIQIAKKLEMV